MLPFPIYANAVIVHRQVRRVKAKVKRIVTKCAERACPACFYSIISGIFATKPRRTLLNSNWRIARKTHVKTANNTIFTVEQMAAEIVERNTKMTIANVRLGKTNVMAKLLRNGFFGVGIKTIAQQERWCKHLIGPIHHFVKPRLRRSIATRLTKVLRARRHGWRHAQMVQVATLFGLCVIKNGT